MVAHHLPRAVVRAFLPRTKSRSSATTSSFRPLNPPVCGAFSFCLAGDNRAVPILYKYLAPERVDILSTGLIMLTKPRAFNDPFEMNPHFDAMQDGEAKKEAPNHWPFLFKTEAMKEVSVGCRSGKLHETIEPILEEPKYQHVKLLRAILDGQYAEWRHFGDGRSRSCK